MKGTEFEVVFFYDLDQALQGDDKEMMNRYFYVGISRATSHLAATLNTEKGNEDILKYFNRTVKDCKFSLQSRNPGNSESHHTRLEKNADSGSVLIKKIKFRKWYRDFFVFLHSSVLGDTSVLGDRHLSHF